MAKNQGLDLIEISPNANPPVCKIMDMGKFKYDAQKKANLAKKKQKKIELLEKKIEGIIFKQPNTEKKNLNIQYDLLTKSENYEVYKEKADNIFSSNEIQKQDIIKGQKLYKKSKKLKRSRELIKER